MPVKVEKVLFAAAIWVVVGVPAFALTGEEIAKGKRFFEAGDFRSAESLFRSAFETDPTDAQALLGMTYSLVNQSKIYEATVQLNHMAEQNYAFLGEYVGQWASTGPNPAGTAQAVVAMQESNIKSMTVGSVAAGWAQADPVAAEQWILNLPAGRSRDNAIQGVLRWAANTGQTPNSALLGAFSSDLVRQERLLFVMMTLARHSPKDARELIDTYFTDSEWRERAERVYATAIGLPKLE